MTQYKPVIGVSEAVTVSFIFISAKTFLTYAVFLYHEGMNATWVIPLIQTAIGLLGVLLLASLLQKFPGRDLVQIGEELTGPYVNLLFGLFYLAVFVLGAGVTLRAISERVVSGFLPDTPISLVALSFVTGTLVVSYLGLEAVTRTARFLVSVLVVSALALVVLTVPFWQWHVFYPLWGAGPLDLLMGAVRNTGDFVQILLLGILFPFLPGARVKAIGVWGVLLAGFAMFVFTLVPLLLFSYPTVSELTLPSFEMARLINLGRFGQRMEVVFLPIWVFGNMIYLAISTYAGAAVMARLAKLSDYRPFVFSVIVLVLTASFVPRNVAQVSYWNNAYLVRYSFGVLMVILALLLLVARLKEGGGGQDENAA